MIRPFLLFGGRGKPETSMAAFLGAHMTIDEAKAQFEADRPRWAELVVMLDDGPKVIWRWPEPEKTE